MADNIEVAFGPLKKFTAEKVKRLIIEVQATLAETTPVDTGHASNNWVPSVVAPSDAVSGTPVAPSNAAASAGIQAVLSDYQFPKPAWVSNNVPYIGPLNDGHSGKAPAGFVEAGILKAIRTVAAE